MDLVAQVRAKLRRFMDGMNTVGVDRSGRYRGGYERNS